MNGEILLLFVILLLALILCTYLGGDNCVNPIFEGMTSNSDSDSKAFTYTNFTTYVAENGSNAEITAGPKGTNLLTVTTSKGKTISYATSSGADINTFYASDGNGGKAIITTDFKGNPTLTVVDTNGTKIIFNVQKKKSNSYFSNSYDNYNHFTGNSHASIYYGPNGETAKIIDAGNGNNIVITYNDGTTDVYYIDKDNYPSASTYVGPNGGIAKIITYTDGKSAVEINGPNGSKIVYTEDDKHNNNTNNIDQNSHYSGYNKDTNNFFGPTDKNMATATATATGLLGAASNNAVNNSSGVYNSSLPQGIPRNQIPAGQEDLYILKSQVVPPICPAVPPPIVKCDCANGGGEFDHSKCRPCPAPERCPEPSFECKRVPTYKAFNQDYMPVPVLNDFSTFGM
jgi:hypothetical protein